MNIVLNILKMVLPLNMLIRQLLKVPAARAVLKVLTGAWSGAEGARTQGALAVAALLALAAQMGLVPYEQVKPLIEVLGGIGAATMVEKIRAAISLVDRVAQETQAAEPGQDKPSA